MGVPMRLTLQRNCTRYTVEDGLVQSALFLGIRDVLLDVTKLPLNLA
jgi:hypothetical protein